jgi:hypothetical protein
MEQRSLTISDKFALKALMAKTQNLRSVVAAVLRGLFGRVLDVRV